MHDFDVGDVRGEVCVGSRSIGQHGLGIFVEISGLSKDEELGVRGEEESAPEEHVFQ